MKKTTLLLLSSIGVIAGCYTSPEMNENKYENMYAESDTACRYADDSYQHKGLRHCMENRIAWEDANKKTVQIVKNSDGSALVVPKTYDDSLMLEKNRVYETIEKDSNAVVVNASADIAEDQVKKEYVRIDDVEEIAGCNQEYEECNIETIAEATKPSEPPLVVENQAVEEDEECEDDCEPAEKAVVEIIIEAEEVPVVNKVEENKVETVRKVEIFKETEKESLPLEEK